MASVISYTQKGMTKKNYGHYSNTPPWGVPINSSSLRDNIVFCPMKRDHLGIFVLCGLNSLFSKGKREANRRKRKYR